MFRFALVLAICLSTGVAATSMLAQEPKAVEEAAQITPENVFKGFFGGSIQTQLAEMGTQVMDVQLDYLTKQETTKKLALFQKNYYDALIDQGFSKQQAFQLVLTFGNPIAHGVTNGG